MPQFDPLHYTKQSAGTCVQCEIWSIIADGSEQYVSNTEGDLSSRRDRPITTGAQLTNERLGGLLKELSSLPSRQAILLGWAVSVPTLVEIAELPEKQRPKSPDPEFWKVWTGEEDRPIDWKKIADDWTRVENRTGKATDPKGKTNTEAPF